MPASGLPDLIALAYESACDPAERDGFVAAMGRYFRADSAAMAVWPRRDPGKPLAATAGKDAEDVAQWLAQGDEPDSLFQRLQTEKPLQSSIAGAPEGAHAGWPQGEVLAVVVEADAQHLSGLVLIRALPGLFSEADQDRLDELAGYMRRAIGINQRFIQVFAEHRATRQLLDTSPRGILVLGQQAQITYINDEARRICNSGDGVSLDDNRPQLTDDDAMASLQIFLAQAGAPGRADAPPASIGLRIRRPSDAPCYQLIAYGLACDARQAAANEREGLAVVMLHDPQVARVPDEHLLNIYFGLTPAESQLVRALCAGLSLPTAAHQASISVNTARTHLRSVFRKVNVHSQAALVQRVAQSLRFTAPLEQGQP